MEGAASGRDRGRWISPPRSGAILRSSMRGAPPTRTFRPRSPTTRRSRRSASSPICARPAARTRSLRRASMSSRIRRSRRSALWFTATSARRTSLQGPDGPVFLDAECAWFGDPAFDLAFCLNHLLLKGAREGRRPGALQCPLFRRSCDAYLAGVDWESVDGLEARAAALLPALFLARVDGKSPVEYLTRESERGAVRRCAEPLVADPPRRLRMSPTPGSACAMSEPVIQSARRAAHLGLARPPDGRSGNQAERRRGGPRHCAGRRVARFP